MKELLHLRQEVRRGPRVQGNEQASGLGGGRKLALS